MQTDSTKQGTRKPQPKRSITGLEMTATAEVPPAGGFRARNKYWKASVKATLRGSASPLSPMGAAMYRRQITPMVAAMSCPPMALRGCEKGDAGAPNMSTAAAPMVPTGVR
jgi:hypothetical protein